MVESVVLNVGCGSTRIPGSIGVDQVEIDGCVDVVHNLNELPYPFINDYADEIHFYHVLEHLDDPVAKMEELHRILKPGGTLFMRVPHFSSHGAFTDITHKRPYSYFSFDIFLPEAYHSWYSDCRFHMESRQIKYFGQYPNEGVYEQYIHNNKCHILVKPIVRTINFLTALSPIAFERLWCFWVGGACEISFRMKKIPAS
jgi:SAM-dependent methyltransferase|tara:strand:- start:848 stop:1447 length:600 start_codon:yes stop_codon:yes gene_type:complete